MFKYLVFLLLVSAGVVHAETEQVTVYVAINDLSDSDVKQIARVKAQTEGALRLPVLVEGQEQLINDQYNESIRAYMFSHVYVDVVSEKWARESNRYSMTANVYIDKPVSSDFFLAIKQNEALKKEMKQLYQYIDKLVLNDAYTPGTLSEIELTRADIVLDGDFLHYDYQTTLEAQERYMMALMDDFVQRQWAPFIETAKLSVEKVTSKEAYLRIWFDAPKDNTHFLYRYDESKDYLLNYLIHRYMKENYTHYDKAIYVDVMNRICGCTVTDKHGVIIHAFPNVYASFMGDTVLFKRQRRDKITPLTKDEQSGKLFIEFVVDIEPFTYNNMEDFFFIDIAYPTMKTSLLDINHER